MQYEILWHRLTGIYDTNEAKAIVRWMLDERFRLSLADIVCGKLDEMSQAECAAVEEMMMRLEQGEPVQYVLGVAEFCGRMFHVEPGVLIPRPETAEMCQWISQKNRSFITTKILDVGTGSGCIAITLALEMPETKVTAWDVSEEALEIAKKNAKALKADVTFEKQDIFDFESHLEKQNSKSFDLIVSNPPYVCEREAAEMERHVLEHEPHLALFVPDDDPLRFYKAIAEYGATALKPNGLLYFELNPLYANDLFETLSLMSYNDIEIKQDQFGKQRFLKAKKI